MFTSCLHFVFSMLHPAPPLMPMHGNPRKRISITAIQVLKAIILLCLMMKRNHIIVPARTAHAVKARTLSVACKKGVLGAGVAIWSVFAGVGWVASPKHPYNCIEAICKLLPVISPLQE